LEDEGRERGQSTNVLWCGQKENSFRGSGGQNQPKADDFLTLIWYVSSYVRERPTQIILGIFQPVRGPDPFTV